MEVKNKENILLEIEEMSNKYHFIKGIKDCMPTILGYLSLGLTCGIVSRSCGLTFWEALGASIFIYGGSSQFIAASMISVYASVPSIILTIFFINFRHLFLSASVSQYFKKNSFLTNLFIGSLLTDETFLVASSEGIKNKKINNWWMAGLNITAYVNWALATAIGYVMCDFISDYKVLGLDFALSAMFIGLLISSIRGNVKIKKAIIIILISMITMIFSTQLLSNNIGVIIAAFSGALSGVVINE